MTTSIESLAVKLEAAATDKVYRLMQNYLKEARDSFSIKLECALNKGMIVLQQECERVATAIRNGNVQEHQPKQAKAKAKAAQPTTHTIDKQEPVAKVSEPKTVATELQLAEAQAEIERLRRELADKTNEVAEYAEALAHARETIVNQAKVIKEMGEQKPVVETEATATEAVVAEVQELADDIVEALVIDTLLTLVNRKYGYKNKGMHLVKAIGNNYSEAHLKQAMESLNIKSSLYTDALSAVYDEALVK